MTSPRGGPRRRSARPATRGRPARSGRGPRSESQARDRRPGRRATRPDAPRASRPARPARPARPRSTAPAELDRLIQRQPWNLLRAPLERAGADVEPALERLKAYARLVLEWNRSVSNIISRNDEARFVERHLVESIAPAGWLKESGAREWLDFGSGAGLPAIPLAIAGVGSRWTLVESRRTKTLFLRKAKEHLSLEHFEVVLDRLENAILQPLVEGGHDGFCSRATMPLGPTLALASSITRLGGSAFLWKGSGYEREMAQDLSWRESWEPAGLERVGSGLNVVARFIRK